MNNHVYKKLLFVAVLISFIVPAYSYAAHIDMNIGSSSYDLQDSFLVDLYLNTDTETVNAIESQIHFDATKLHLVEIIDSESVVSFWIEKNIEGGNVSVSGIVPGGFHGGKGRVISLFFETIGSGATTIDLNNTFVFRNDGMGTKEPVFGVTKSLTISEKISQNKSNQNPFLGDVYPPESFKPEISQSSSLFDNKWFLVFTTQDKNSGVSHYLLKEARFRALMFFKRWSVVESPYVLRDQNRTSFIAIKAIDNAGNEIIEKVYPQNEKSMLEKVLTGLGGLVILVMIVWVLKKLMYRLIRPDPTDSY